jgi:hypothetical protein
MQPSDEAAWGIGVSGGPRVEPEDPALPISAGGAVVGALSEDRHTAHDNRKSHNQSDGESDERQRRQQTMQDRGEVDDHRGASVGFTGGPAG